MGFVNNIISKLKTDKQFAKMFYIAAVVFVLAVVIIIACVSCAGSEEAPDDATQQEATVDGETAKASEEATVPVVDYTVPDVLLEENAHADVNDLVQRYFNAMTNGDSATITAIRDSVPQEELIKIEKESAYIDEFDGIKVYTKPGPMAGSYVAFVYYEIKFTGIDTLAPGLTTLYVCPKEDGSLYICDGNMTDQDTEYIKSIVAQTDVADLFAMVETKYAEAIDADASLNEFMGNLAAKLDEEVSQAMAQLETESGEADQTEEEPQEEEQQQSQAVDEIVKATDTVNVRASDSENADRIGRVAMGDTVKRFEKKENGWSRVEYEGQEGYIKSEYLELVESAGNAEAENEVAEEPDEEEQVEEEQEDAPATDLTAKGKVTIKEAVNVRKSASTSADKLGMAYQGETYELIMEQADGWCKIKFKGETGYVKTEFVE